MRLVDTLSASPGLRGRRRLIIKANRSLKAQRGNPMMKRSVIVSPALSARHEGRIAYAEYDAQTDPARPAGDRDHHASDHRPIVVDIT